MIWLFCSPGEDGRVDGGSEAGPSDGGISTVQLCVQLIGTILELNTECLHEKKFPDLWMGKGIPS